MRDLNYNANILVEKIRTSNNVLLFGVGKSYEVARLSASLLRSVQVSAVAVHATDVMHGDLNFLMPGFNHTAIGISHSGETAEVIKALAACRRASRNIHTALITGRQGGMSADHQYLRYTVAADGSRHGTIPTESVRMQLAWVNEIVCRLADILEISDLHRGHLEGALGDTYEKRDR